MMKIRTPALLIAAVTLGLAACGASSRPSAPGSPSAPASTAATTASTASGSSVTDQVIAWRSGPGMTALQALGTRMAAFSRVAIAGNASGAASACSALADAITTAQSAPPIPDPAAQRWYVRALAHLSKAAADCQAGAQAQSAAMINESTVALAAGARDLVKVTAAIQALNGG